MGIQLLAIFFLVRINFFGRASQSKTRAHLARGLKGRPSSCQNCLYNQS